MRAMALSWLSGRSVASVREALRQHAPELSNEDVELRPWIEQNDPKWWYGSAVVARQYFVKFAWSHSAAEKVWHEACVLKALDAHSGALRTPRVVVALDNPVLLATEWIAGEPLTIEHVGQMDSKRLAATAGVLAQYLADLHSPEVLAAVTRVAGSLGAPQPQATISAIRTNLAQWIRSDQVGQVRSVDGVTGLTRSWRFLSNRSSFRATSMVTTNCGIARRRHCVPFSITERAVRLILPTTFVTFPPKG
jgi:hypothetical protein